MAVGETINLLDYLELIVKHRRKIILLTLGAFVASIVISTLLPKIYSSTARIIPPQQDQGMVGLMIGQQMGGAASMASDLLGKSSSAEMYASILKSEAIKDAIIDRFSLMEVYKQKYRLDTYKKLDKNTTIVAGKKDGIISITVEDEDPNRAAEMANAFTEELGRIVAGLNTIGSGQSRTFLEGRLAIVKADLVKAEDALRNFSLKNKAIQISEQSKAAIEGISKLKAQLAVQEVNLATYQNYLTDSNQEVKSTKAAISNLKSQIALLEGTSNAGAIPSVGSVPTLGQEYLRLMREYKIKETLLDLLTKQYELSSLSEAKNFVATQIIQKARVPDKKSKPERAKIVLVSTTIALFASILIAFILEYVSEMPSEQKERCMLLIGKCFSFK